MSPLALLFGAGVLLAAGFVRGYSGFGFSAVTVTGFSIVASPALAVPLAILLEVLSSLFQARSIWRHIAWRDAMAMLAGSLAGNPPGVMALQIVPETALKTSVYIYVLAVCVILLFARSTPREIGNFGWFAVGLFAGAINGATALSGLFIVTVMTLTATAPARMRATLIAYFFFSDFYAAGLLAANGFIGMDFLLKLGLAFPVVAVGIALGSRRFLGASDLEFRRATLLLLAALAIAGLASLLV